MQDSVSLPVDPVILSLFNRLDAKLDSIMHNKVRVDYCNDHRTRCLSENGKDHREIFDRLKACEEQCSVFKAMFPQIPSEGDIVEARTEAIEKASAAARAGDGEIVSRIGGIENRLSGIEDKLKILDASYWSACHFRSFVKNNKMVAGFVAFVILSSVGEWLTFAGVMLGRMYDFVLT